MRFSPELQHIAQCLADLAGINRAERPAVRDIDWTRWLLLAGKNQVSPLLGSRLAAEWSLPRSVAEELNGQYAREAGASTGRFLKLLDLLAPLEKEAEFIMLKGVALIPVLYHDVAERPMYDVDILFRSETEAKKVRTFLAGEGYTPKPEKHAPHHHLPAMVNSINTLAFELHWNLTMPPLPEGFMDEIWAKKRRMDWKEQAGFWILDPAALLAHHCLHALNDPIDAPLLRNLFEVAWLASRLSGPEREDFKARVERWKLDTFVARALWLASDLFGSPALLPRPRPGAYEFWSAWRLERSEYNSVGLKFMKQIADAHIPRLLSGAGDRDIFVFLHVLFTGIGKMLRTRYQDRFSALRGAPCRGPMWEVEIGNYLMLYDDRTGETHLLNELAMRIWKMADGRLKGFDVLRRLREEGIDEVEARRAIRTLLQKGILDQAGQLVQNAES